MPNEYLILPRRSAAVHESCWRFVDKIFGIPLDAIRSRRNDTSSDQYISAVAMKNIIHMLHDIKYIVTAAGVLLAFLIDKNLGPAEDDLPLRFKIILAAPVIVSIVYVLSLTANQRLEDLPYVVSLLIVSVLTYATIWSLLGYRKEITVARPRWKFWGGPDTSKKIRVMGGRFQPDARKTIEREHITVQRYFEGTAFDQGSVWTRKSRAAAQALIIFIYIIVIGLYTLTIAMALT